MAKMIIDVPDNMQEMCKLHKEGICDLMNIEVDILAEAVINGIVIPKGHGRLIDADKLKERYLYMSNDDTAIEGMEYVTKGMIENAEVVIEADKGSEKI